MGAIYEEHKDEDGFLYIAYSGENTFGMWWTNYFKYELVFYYTVRLVFLGVIRLAWWNITLV